MKLVKKITTDPWFTRSINLTRDADSIESIAAYIPTSTTKSALQEIANGFDEDGRDRAFTLMGPYGSGKSSFALFLNAILSHEDKEMQKLALQKLKDFDKTLHSKIQKHVKNKKIFKVVLSGSYDSFEKHLVEGLNQKIIDLAKSEKVNSKLLKQAALLAKNSDPSPQKIVDLITDLQTELFKLKFSSFFITVDELGKFLEYTGAMKKDIFVLQQISELSGKADGVPLFFIGLLHQSLEYYAQNLSLEVKQEWSKIQGRFNSVTFSESSEQMIRIIGSAIKKTLSQQDLSSIRAKMKDSVYYFLEDKVFTNLSGKRPSLELFMGSYPFHPVSSAILPTLAQKLGQNERTVFTYLGSKEAFGFQEQIKQKENQEFIMPHDLFDYFYTNQSSFISDHVINKRWIEVLNALDRVSDDEIELTKLLKTIGLINIVGSVISLRCTKDLLETLFAKTDLQKMFKELEKKSLIIYRKFNNEYRIWQGSDFDFESSLRFELDQLHDFDLAAELNNILPAKPLLARKQSIQSGTLRFFDCKYASSGNIEKLLQQSSALNPHAYIIFEDAKKLSQKNIEQLQKINPNTLLIKVQDNSFVVNESRNLKALNNILATSDDLASDPIAKKEVISQIDQTKKKIQIDLKQIFLPKTSAWYWRGTKLLFSNELDLQQHLSSMLSTIFNRAPCVNNELINKDQISAQGQAARVRLMKDMLNQRQLLELGYPEEKAPPEKGMFKAIFKDHGIVQIDVDGTKFINPNKDSEFALVYQLIEKTLSGSSKPIAFNDLSKILRSAPYGIKKGLHPVIFLAFYLANEENIAIYEGSLYKPYFNDEAIDRLASKSPTFGFTFHSFEGQNKIIEEYANVLSKDSEEKNVLSIVRKLSKTMSVLPEYTLSTQSALSNEAMRFRSAFLYSKSPLDLLVKDIPEALGFKESELKKAKILADFSSMLNRVLSDLKGCYVSLILNQKQNFCFAFDLDGSKDFKELRPELYEKLIMLEDYAIDTKSIKPFLRKLLDREKEDQEWFESLLGFLVKKHPKKWNDENITEVEIELKKVSDKIKDLSKMRVYESSKKISSAHDLDIFVMRIKKKGADEKDIITTLSKSERSNYEKFKKEILQILHKYSKDSEDQLSLLSPLVDDILNGNVSKKDILKIVKDGD